MSRHMILWDEGDPTDSVRVYTEDPSVLVVSERKDLQILKEIPEASRAGIYVLMGEQTRYVGQASGSVWARINSHDKNKDWWSKVLFFSRIDGHLDKSQLDYLESKLIRQFTTAGFEMENKDTGNSSYIGPYQRGQAESLLSTVESILLKDIGLDIFKKKSKSKEASNRMILKASEKEIEVSATLEKKKKVEFVLSSSLFGVIQELYYKRMYTRYFELSWSKEINSFKEKVVRENLICLTKDIESSRMRFYTKVDEEYSLFVNCSRVELDKRINKVANSIGDTVTIDEVEKEGSIKS